MKSLRLHLVFATSTTRQLVSPILHFKTTRKHSCEVPQCSQGGQLKTHPDIHVRVVWDTRKESVEERLARKRKIKSRARLAKALPPPALCWFHDSGQGRGPAARTVLYNQMWQPVRHPVIPMAAAQCCIIIYDCDNWVPSHGELKHATANLENYSVRADGSECWSGCKTAPRRSCLFVFKHKKSEAYKGFCHRPLCSSHQ